MSGPLDYWVRGQMDAHGRFTRPGGSRRTAAPTDGCMVGSAGMRPWVVDRRPQLRLIETTRYLHIEGTPWDRWFRMHRVEPDPNPFPRFRIWRWWP